MASVTKTFSADGASSALALGPGETATVSIVVASTKTFKGLLAIERSIGAGAAFEPVRSVVDVVLIDDDDIAAGTTTHTIKNITPKTQNIRARVLGYDGDPVAVTIADVAGDILEVLVSDGHNNAVIIRTDAGIRIVGGVEALGDVSTLGALTAGSVVAPLASSQLVYADVVISAADIIATGAGKFGHASGFPLVAAPGAAYVAEFISAIMVNDRDTAAYTAGGNITVNLGGGGAALTGVVSAAASLGAATDTVAIFRPLSTAAQVATANVGFNLVAATAFTNPGTAAGVLRIRTYYRLHATGL